LYPEIGKVPFEEIEKQANTFYSLTIKELESQTNIHFNDESFPNFMQYFSYRIN
jgi:hypothetical protein